jgi:hypothetical protein
MNRADDLRQHCRALIAASKVPKNVFVAPEIGLAAMGTMDYLTVGGP